MASTDFLTNTKLTDYRPVRIGGELVTTDVAFRRLKDVGSGMKLSPARLLAEPALGSESGGRFRNATWFCAYEGEAQRLTDLQGAARERAETRLRENLAALEPLLADRGAGPLLGRALLIPSLDDVYVVNGQPVLTNWGFVPEGLDDSDTALAEHFAATLGRFANYERPWSLSGAAPDTEVGTDAPSAAAAGAAARSGAATVAGAAGGGGGNEPPTTVIVSDDDRPWYLTAGFFAFYVALVLAVGLMLGWFLHPTAKLDGLPKGVDQSEAQRGINNSLRAEIGRIETLLQGDVCGVEAEDYMNPVLRDAKPLPPESQPDAATADAGDESAGAAPDAAAGEEPADESADAGPEDADEESVADETEEDTPEEEAPAAPSRATVRESLEESVVIVVVRSGETAGNGTGFFVTPDTIITNQHVVGDTPPDDIRVASQALGRVLPATLVTTSPPGEIGQRDYAILKIAEPAGNVLTLAPDVEKLARIFVGGYPGHFTKLDPRLRSLMQGDPNATPEMSMALGDVILVRESMGAEVPLVIHTADVRPGNSGGPLLDSCGRVVGINTFINFDEDSNRPASWSLHSADLAAFLTENKVSFQMNEAVCPQ
jgi:hypothetical protein